ncbi:MAG: manganese efflux pump MntP family protein [Candidatus Omnitrophica bacterium]|nr:manganese efflux pump MntP family protein [Candidatus Omnitrophota bacterium]
MGWWGIIILALGLAMDAFAVAIASGLVIQRSKIRYALKIAFFFGVFQTFMAVAGWTGGSRFARLIQHFDHWIAFLLLCFIGSKMIVESQKSELAAQSQRPWETGKLLLLSVATSIDSLAAGVGLAFLAITIVRPALIIGLVAFSLSLAGVLIGKKLGQPAEGRVKILGGLILVGIGIKILVEHLI